MKLQEALKNSWKYLPIGSMTNYIDSGQAEIDNQKSKRLFYPKFLLHALYFFGGAILISTPLAIGSISFVEQINRLAHIGKINLFEERKTIYELREEKRNNELKNNLSKLADSNNDGLINIDERVEAYKRMGLDEKIRFPEPSVNDLERAIKSYTIKQ